MILNSKYDDDFRKKYIDRLGNYLLLSGSHNESLSNRPFEEKRKTYKMLAQQIEVYEMTKDKAIWGKAQINARQKKLTEFILKKF